MPGASNLANSELVTSYTLKENLQPLLYKTYNHSFTKAAQYLTTI